MAELYSIVMHHNLFHQSPVVIIDAHLLIQILTNLDLFSYDKLVEYEHFKDLRYLLPSYSIESGTIYAAIMSS